MRPTLRTRKPINALLPEDLIAFPVLEFAKDEEGVDGKPWSAPHIKG